LTAVIVAQALQAGCRHIDTAQTYGTEHGPDGQVGPNPDTYEGI
jgi:diketogulonate reductase-like aldo/keto reductase